MRQIKFRGRVPESDAFDGGRIAYGSLVIYESGALTHWIYTPNAERNYPVEPESVEQLIAIDKSGREIYEKDVVKLVNAPEEKWPATFEDYVQILEGDVIYAGD